MPHNELPLTRKQVNRKKKDITAQMKNLSNVLRLYNTHFSRLKNFNREQWTAFLHKNEDYERLKLKLLTDRAYIKKRMDNLFKLVNPVSAATRRARAAAERVRSAAAATSAVLPSAEATPAPHIQPGSA